MSHHLHAIALIMALVASLSGCSQTYRFEGVVVDGDGNPVSGATIELFPADWDPTSSNSKHGGTSNADGSFDAGWCCAPGIEFFRMTVTKDGFQTDSRMVEADAKHLRIVLERTGQNATTSDPG